MSINFLRAKTIRKKEKKELIGDFFEKSNQSVAEADEAKTASYEDEKIINQMAKIADLHWKAYEFEKTEWSWKWYIAAVLILGSIIVYALITNSPVMAITFFLLGIAGYFHLQKNPRFLDFMITPKGITAGTEIFEYSKIISFWIFYEPHFKIISLKTRGGMIPHIHIPLADQDPVKVREVLLKYLPEEEQKITVFDVIEKFLRL